MFRHSQTSEKRVKDDFYETPSEAILPILQLETLKGTILEPCAGSGKIVKATKEFYPRSKVLGLDIYPRGKGITKQDFFCYNKRVDNILTNPPYKQAQRFIEHSLRLANNKAVMLLQLGFLESKGRYDLFKSTPLKTVYVFSNRITCDAENGTKRIAYAWFVWDHSYEGEPTIDWIKLR